MLPILLIVATLGLIWGVILIQRGGLIGGCLATLAAGSCLGHPFFHISVLTLDRALFLIVGVLYVGFRRMMLVQPKPLSKPDIVLAAFLSVLLLSTFSHNWRLDGAQPAATLLFFYLMPVGLYWVARQAPLSEKHILWVFGFLSLLGVYLSLTAMAEVKGWWFLVFPKYIGSPEHVEFFGRARGPYLNPIGNGIYLCACLAGQLMWWPRANRAGKVAIAGLAVFTCLAAYFTLTRSVWMGAAAMLLTLAALTVPRRFRLGLLVAVLLLGASVVVSRWDHLVAFKRDKHVSASEMAESANLRPILAAYAWEMFRDRPFAGCGFGQYRQVNVDYQSRRSFDVPMEKAKQYVQHNVFLSLLTETGLMGVTLFVLLLGFWLGDGWRLWNQRAAPLWKRQQGLLSLLVLIAYLPNGMFHEVSIISMINMLVFFVAGTTRGLVLASRGTDS